MARLIPTPTSGGLVGAFERLVLQTLLEKLPDDYQVAPNFQIKPKNHDALEYDFIVLAPHAIYVIEAKEWYGRLTGDDTEWILNQTPKKPPIWLANTKCKVLKSELGALGNHTPIAPLLVLPDGTQNLLGGSWASSVRSLSGSISYQQDPSKLPKQADIRAYHESIVQLLQGKWGTRKRAARRRIGSYELLETVYADERSAEHLAKRALIEGDTTKYRIRTFRLDQNLPAEALERQKAVLCRPTEAVSKIGPHANLLRVLQFDFSDEDSEFFEVTEWSEFGTLHGYLANLERDRLTLRERLEIAEGVAAALEAVHEHGIVHRNVCPETILVGFDRKPRLTDFDRAYVDSKHTVYAATEQRRRNPAYVPPELEDATDYDFDTSSDMYSFGVLLYKLLADREPFENPKAARAAKGLPASLPGEQREGIEPRIDQLILQLLRVDDFKARPTAAQVLAVLRAAKGQTTGHGAAKTSDLNPPASPPQRFEKGSILDNVWRIDDKAGSGGFSKVFKVYSLDHQKTYAMKILDDEDNVDMMLYEFNEIQPSIPSHPNIAKIFWMGRLGPPERTPYLLSEFVDGETLEPYCDGRKRLPWTDIKRIGLELLDALAAIHPDTAEYAKLRALSKTRDLTAAEADAFFAAQERASTGIFHRDIKPANILLELPSHRPKLIDFNIAAKAGEATKPAGTPRYWAPDRGVPGGRADADLFSLGVVLYEMVTERHPYAENKPGNGDPYDPRDITIEFKISTELGAFLLKAVQPDGADRFATAREMHAALAGIESMYAPAEPPSTDLGLFPGITVAAEEAQKGDYNPYVTRLLTLYSQARRSNAGTRGLDEIGKLTYVDTRLDERLAPAIVSGLFRLVVVTGNAGDGKTAFLQKVETLFQKYGATIDRLPTGNGSRWTFGGVRYETNYDGSQDEGDRESDAVLAQFFEPFMGPGLSGLSGKDVRLVAINEGRLLDFLAHSQFKAKFEGLREFVNHALAGQPTPEGALLVNLNLRAVTAGGSESLVEKQLVAMLDAKLWKPCDGCAHKQRCPIKHNVDTLRDNASGPPTRERVRRLFEIVHLRRRAHVTMRDLRSALSWMVLRDQSCDDIAKLLSRTDPKLTRELVRLYYSDAFADPEGEGTRDEPRANGSAAEERAVDRLVRRLREADVGLVNSPLLDRRLDHDPRTAVPWMTYEGRANDAWEIMQAFTKSTLDVGDEVLLPQLMKDRRHLLATWRRWAYFERRDEGWRAMLPYRATSLIERIVGAKDDEDRAKACEQLRDIVVDAISVSEGVRNAAIRKKYLALKVTRTKDASVRSYRLFPKESFRIEVAAPSTLVNYLEHEPDAVEFVADGGSGAARLRISLDLLEMLELVRNGYRPTMADLQGLFVNLLIFRNELSTSTFRHVLVTADDVEFFEISAEGRSDGIRLTLERHAGTAEPRREVEP